jgi:SAM-dependent methyltransferase
MTEFWESAFIDKQAMWGFTPALSAVTAKDLFLAHGIKNVLIPGIGYGRNAEVFRQNGMGVTGIEISKTAIELARKYCGSDIKIYHGSVTDMPFDDKEYDGIFCYALIHLLDAPQRIKFIRDCYNQLKPGGYMVFVTISKEDPMFGIGTQLDTDRFERIKGAQIFFYDADSVRREFGPCGLTEFSQIDEPTSHADKQPPHKFLTVTCKK